VTNFGMGLYAFPQQRMSKEEEQALSLRSLKRELSPQEEWLYRQYQMSYPPVDSYGDEPVPHRYGEQEFMSNSAKKGGCSTCGDADRRAIPGIIESRRAWHAARSGDLLCGLAQHPDQGIQ